MTGFSAGARVGVPSEEHGEPRNVQNRSKRAQTPAKTNLHIPSRIRESEV